MRSKNRYLLGLVLLILCSFGIRDLLADHDGLEEPPVAEQYNRILYKSELNKTDGSEVLIREAYFPPGWKAPRHYHNGNLFIYVIDGEFEVELEESEKIIYHSGDALQMMPGVEMEARNASAENPLKLSVFQVGKPDAPFVVPVQ